MQKINRRTVLTGSVAAYAATGLGLANATSLTPTKHKIVIKKFRFQPDRITVRVGDTIAWINQDIVPHTATADAGDWDTEKLNKGESNSVVVTEEMTGRYFCVFHPKMKGEIKIE
jgi:plastocyanin